MFKFLYKHRFSTWGIIYLGVELLNHIITLCSTLWRIARMFTKVAAPCYIPLAVYKETFVFAFLFDRVVVCHCSFDLHSKNLLSIFSCADWSSVYVLWINVYLYLLPIFKLGHLLFYYWLVRVLYSIYKSLIRFANIFSFYGLSFLFLNSVLCSIKVSNLDEVQIANEFWAEGWMSFPGSSI